MPGFYHDAGGRLLIRGEGAAERGQRYKHYDESLSCRFAHYFLMAFA
jgi:hypothetical protein